LTCVMLAVYSRTSW